MLEQALSSAPSSLHLSATPGRGDGGEGLESVHSIVRWYTGSWEYAVEIRILAQDVRQLRYIFNQQRTIVQDRQSMRDVSATFAVTVTSPSPSPLL